MEDDSPKALPVLGELSKSDNDISELVFIWGTSEKAAAAASGASAQAGEREREAEAATCE